jgi:hypothetical protein
MREIAATKRGLGRVCKFGQQMQPLPRVPAVDGICREWNRIANAVRLPGRDQGGRGIQQHHVATAGALAIQDGANDGGVFLSIAPRNLV